MFGPYSVNAHNAWLDAALASGVFLATLSFLFFWAYFLQPLRRRLPQAGNWKTVRGPIAIMIVTVTVVYSTVEAAVYRPMYAVSILTMGLVSILGVTGEEIGTRRRDIANRGGWHRLLGPGSPTVGK
jgi:hypothetical protein